MQKAADITDLDTWLYAYKKGKPGVKLALDGTFTVINTKKPEDAPRVIPHSLGVDAYRVLNDGEHPELRAAATAKLTELEVADMGIVDTAYETFRAAESAYMTEIEKWEQEHSTEHAMGVARAQRALAKADAKYRDAKFKHRSILSLNDLPRLVLDYRTKDDRSLLFTLELGKYEINKSAERVLPLVTAPTEGGTA
jgi:hypothetical protein